jgi:hypothetical protein
VLKFGYSEGLPSDRTVAWGARLIVTQDGSVDMVWDRQDIIGEEAARQRLHNYLVPSVLAVIVDSISVLLKTGKLLARERKEVKVFQNSMITCVGNCNASHGYCYIVVYFTDPESQ